MIRRPPRSPLFPYTTPFRSHRGTTHQHIVDTVRTELAKQLLTEPRVTVVQVTRGSVRSCFASSVLTVDRKSTRLNSSHQIISYAVFCLKKKNLRRAGRVQIR